ncbi:hypothetical protein RJ640_002335 [Escallonia rubra]|uniref:Thaumatin-like protein n=1 Tax=Escallonia rubra TaxID=112253 RepID=A0AA88QCQ6_9ASTE|nr:hypothetical protein RJ640_002335 [Escallonia rubra]
MRLCVCTNFTIINDCKETIWPGITPNSNFSGGGFTLKPGQSAVFAAPPGWGGRIWGRTGCSFDKNGNGTCQTGGCGGSIKCASPGAPPASIAEFSLGQLDFYDVSLVDGFNLPVVVTPINGKGNCNVVGCDNDLRSTCPSELAAKSDGKTIACRSACNVFDTDEYCCRGMYSNPVTCVPTNYSSMFKALCPTAYSYAYDDPTSILTCSTSDYVVTFCGSRNQTECSYHDQKLVCSSNGLKALPHVWSIPMLALPTLISSLVLP